MKKILLILLAFTSFASFAQAEFPEGIALSGNASSSNTTKVVVQEPTSGNLNYINALDLPASTADKLKGYLSTGLIKNGLISANGDPTKFNITAGIGIISNFDDPENPISTIINFPAFNSITPTYLTTGNITYVAINSTPAVVMQATPFTPEQRRSLIVLGATIHSNLTTINVLNNISAPTNADTNQLHDFMEAVGALNITGNKYTANGANLQLNKSAGVLFKLGSNFAVDWKNPHEIAQSGGTTITFRYRTQNGTESADMTSISPGLYDLNNVLTTVPNNKFTIQTVTVFQTGLTRIQWGQAIYDDLQSAKNAILIREFVVENNIKENGVTRAYIIVKNNTTSLQNVADAYISEAQKFGGVASGGVALTLANIVTALGYTPENEANKSDSFTVSSSTTYSSTKALVDGLATKQNTLTNPVTGTGTTNTIPKWTGTTTQGNSMLTDISGEVSLNQTNNTSGFKIKGFANPAENVNIFINSANNTTITATKALTFNSGSTSPIYFRPGTGGVFFNDNNTAPLYFGTGGAPSLFNTFTNNGQGVIQANGNITASPATLSNQVTTFGQVFTSPTFTGVPIVPTATAGTNTTQIASTAFVNSAVALSASKWTQTGNNITNNNIGNVIVGNGAFTVTAVGNVTANYIYPGTIEGGRVIGLTGISNTGALFNYQTDLSSTYTDRSFTDKGYVDKNRMISFTVATLPSSPIQGDSYAVTDALAPAYLVTVVGGGTVYAPVVWNGTNWVSH